MTIAGIAKKINVTRKLLRPVLKKEVMREISMGLCLGIFAAKSRFYYLFLAFQTTAQSVKQITKKVIMENDPETLIQSLKTAWPALGGAIAAVAAIAIKFKPIVAFLPKAWKVCAALLVGPTKILEKMEEQDKQRVVDQETVAKISESLTVVIKRLDNQDEKLKELVHNGGSSLKDAVVNISNQISILDKKCNVLFEASGKAVYECDKTGACIWTNKALNKIFGLDSAEMLGSGWLAALHNEDVEKTIEHFYYCLKTKNPYRARYRIVKEGQIVNIETTAIISKNAKDEVTGVVGEVRIID